jgi:hypothetical protein
MLDRIMIGSDQLQSPAWKSLNPSPVHRLKFRNGPQGFRTQPRNSDRGVENTDEKTLQNLSRRTHFANDSMAIKTLRLRYAHLKNIEHSLGMIIPHVVVVSARKGDNS